MKFNVILSLACLSFLFFTLMMNCQQAVAGISQISFAAEGSISPKKPATIPEVAKQRELSGTLQCESDLKKKLISDAKNKELSGHDIFGPPPEIKPRPMPPRSAFKESKDMEEPAPRVVHTSVKVSNVSEAFCINLFSTLCLWLFLRF